MSLVHLVTHLNGFILVAYGHLQLINELVMFLGGPSLTVLKSLNKKIHIILKSSVKFPSLIIIIIIIIIIYLYSAFSTL